MIVSADEFATESHLVLETGALAPHFTLLGIDGREYTLPRDLEAKPAVLVFFKERCETCDIAFPYINRLREAYPDGEWTLWAIAQEPFDTAKEYANRFGVACPVLIDAPEYDVSATYDPESTPTLFLLDERGRTIFDTYGFVKEDLNELSRRLAEAIGAEPVVIAEDDDGQPAMRPGCMPRHKMPKRFRRV
jgi:peroxiredoxin